MISKEGRNPAGPVGLVDAVGAPVDLMDSRAGGADECPPLVLLARHAPAMASALSPAAVTGLHARPGPGLREQLGPSVLGYQRMPTDAPRDRVTAGDRR